MRKIHLYFLIAFILLQSNFIYSQTVFSNPGVTNLLDLNHISQKNISKKLTSVRSDDPVTFGSYLFLLLLYAINPILLYENGNSKGFWGFTKEVSLGFGDLGQYRTSLEYSFVDRGHDVNMLRAGLKYDILLKKNINRSKDVKSSVITLGGGYYTDFDDSGFYPEISYGYSFRYMSDHVLVYPGIKFRYTFMNDSPDLTDFSAGIVIGFTVQ